MWVDRRVEDLRSCPFRAQSLFITVPTVRLHSLLLTHLCCSSSFHQCAACCGGQTSRGLCRTCRLPCLREGSLCVCVRVCARVFACLALNSGYICLLFFPSFCIPVDGFIFFHPGLSWRLLHGLHVNLTLSPGIISAFTLIKTERQRDPRLLEVFF